MQKARQDLKYTELLFNEAQSNYYKLQQSLAAFIDGNMNVVPARYRITQVRLQNEAAVSYSVYNEMAKQLKVAKMKVQDTKPVS